jgi:hypothetical protein
MSRKTLPQAVTIQRDEQDPESMELVAQAIIDIADGFAKMRKIAEDRLIVLLLHDLTGVGKPSIRAILAAAPKIRDTYLR